LVLAFSRYPEFAYRGKLPEGFEDDSIDAEEIMTEILGYKILGP